MSFSTTSSETMTLAGAVRPVAGGTSGGEVRIASMGWPCGGPKSPLAEPPVSVRLNPAKTGADTLPAGPDAGLPVPEAAGLPALAIAGRVPWSRDGRYLAVRPSFTLDPDFHAGAYYVQEASSQFVGHLLAAVRTEGARILDLCTGSGCIGIACAYEFRDAEVVLGDLSFEALEVANQNIERHGVEEPVGGDEHRCTVEVDASAVHPDGLDPEG